jgi:cobalamin biosynthesis protein CbiD
MAHGSDQHVLGTVAAIDATHIEVKTPKGASVTVKVTDQTKFTSKSAKGPKVPPKPGDRVVIDVMTEGTTITATEVQYSSPKPKTP